MNANHNRRLIFEFVIMCLYPNTFFFAMLIVTQYIDIIRKANLLENAEQYTRYLSATNNKIVCDSMQGRLYRY